MEKDVEKAQRAFVIISDIEMSCGGPIDDFPHSGFLKEFILQYNQPPYLDVEVDLVFNGDTFDFLKTGVEGEYPHLVDEDMALKKLALVEHAHREFFEALTELLSFSKKPRRVHFIVGNHDQEILFPKVQDRIVSLCGNSGQVFFPGFEMRVGDLLVEHGSQQDQLFRVPPDKHFLQYNDKKILNLPWASVTLINTFIPFRHEFYALDRIQPKLKIFEILPELKEWMLNRLWNYWGKDYLREYLRSSDPLKKISWAMIKEGFKRSLFFNPDIEMGQHFHKEMQKDTHIRVTVIGHGHDPKVFSHGNRKVIQAGCFRDEFMTMDGKTYEPIPKSYTEVFFKDNQVISSNLLEITGPDISESLYPKPLEEYRSAIQEKLNADKQLNESLPVENPSALMKAKRAFMDIQLNSNKDSNKDETDKKKGPVNH